MGEADGKVESRRLVETRPAAEVSGLQERSYTLAAVLDSLDTAVIGCDADAMPVLANQAARDLLGPLLDVPLAEWPHRLSLRDADDRPLAMDDMPLVRALRGERVRNMEMTAKRPGAALRVFRVHGRPVTDGGRLAAVVAIHEITAQRRATRLKECELQIAEVVSRPEPADTVLTDAVELIGRMLGWEAAAFYWVDQIGQVLRLLTCWTAAGREAPCDPPDQLAQGEGLAGRAWASSESEWGLHPSPEPGVAWAAADRPAPLHAAVAVPIPSGTVTLGVLVFYSDVVNVPDDASSAVLTGIGAHIGEFLERRRAEQYAAELDRTRDEYIALVGHELRTPLTSIQSYTDFMLSDPDLPTAERTEMLEVMQRNATKLHGLVGKLLDVAGIRSGHLPVQPQPTNLAALVRTVVDEVRDNARVDVNTPGEAFVHGDPQRLRQVVEELLTNALAWAREGSTVGVNLHADDNTCVLSVSNTGERIVEAERSRVFEAFFRTDAARSRAVPGAGLGLTLARAIIEQHGGSVIVGEPDEATTTFIVRLPSRRPPADPGGSADA